MCGGEKKNFLHGAVECEFIIIVVCMRVTGQTIATRVGDTSLPLPTPFGAVASVDKSGWYIYDREANF